MAQPATQSDSLAPGALLRAVVDAIRAHPVPLLLPFVLLGLVSGGGGGGPRGPVEPGPDPVDGFQAPDLSPGEILAILAAASLIALVFIAVLLLLYALAWLITTRVALNVAQGEGGADLGAAFDAVRPDYWGGVLTLLLWGLGVFVGLVLLVIPGLFLIVAWTPWAAVVVAERKRGGDALSRAWRLTEGHRWDLFLLLLVAAAASIAVSTLVGWVPFIGGALAGAAQGVVTAAGVVLGAIYYHRVTAGAAPVAPAPDVAPGPGAPEEDGGA